MSLKKHLLFLPFLAYFVGLSVFARGFSYLNINLMGIPLYIGEIALLYLVFWVYRHRTDLFQRRYVWVLATLGIFILWGLFGTIRALVFHRSEFGTMQILRDSALYYQAFWMLFGMTLTPYLWKIWFTALMAGVAYLNIAEWISFMVAGTLTSDISYNGYNYGNDVISPLFPLLSVLYGFPVVMVFSCVFGHALSK